MSGHKKLSKAGRKPWFLAACVLVLLAAVVAVFNEEVRQPTMKFGSRTIAIEEANSSRDRERGLSGREGITDSYGMLFDFERKGQHCMWMKDMHFPIDILWLDENKKVMEIASSIPPESFPSNFCPAEDATYVLEVQSGLSETAGVDVGEQL